MLIAVGIVVLVSAICSLLEAVLYATPASQIESLAQRHLSGRVFKRLRAEVDRPITAILSLNTIANTAGAAIAGAIAASVLGDRWVTYFSAALTLIILVFSEVLPKTAGVVYSRNLARFVALPLQGLVWLFMPIVSALQHLTKLISGGRSREGVSEEELVLMTRLGLKSGTIDVSEAEVIENILSLKDKTVASIMTPRTVVFSLSVQLTIEGARRDRQILNYSRIPIYDGDPEDIVGIVQSREILAAEDPKEKLLSLLRPVQFVPESMTLERLLRMFLEERRHMVIVIGRFGGFSGVVTLEDVLEEILGRQIVDEFDDVDDLRELAHSRREALLKATSEGNPTPQARRGD